MQGVCVLYLKSLLNVFKRMFGLNWGFFYSLTIYWVLGHCCVLHVKWITHHVCSEPALKLDIYAEKRSRHFSVVCLDQRSLWRCALFQSSSLGHLFLGPWLSPCCDTMGPLYLHVPLLWGIPCVFFSFFFFFFEGGGVGAAIRSPILTIPVNAASLKRISNQRSRSAANRQTGKRLAGIRLYRW